MKANIYDYILKRHAISDDLRPILKKVSTEGSYVVSCANGHMATRVKKKHVGLEYAEIEGYPSTNKHFDKESREQSIINVDALIPLLNSFQYKLEMKPCEDCDGSGEAICDCCGNNTECEECDGSGERGTPEPMSLVLPETDVYMPVKVDVLGVSLNAVYITMIINAALMVGAKKLKVNHMKEEKSTIFIAGNVEFLLMHLYQS